VDVGQEEAAFSAASFALASALAAVRAARSECHAAVIYCVNRPNGSASTFVSGLGPLSLAYRYLRGSAFELAHTFKPASAASIERVYQPRNRVS
jgi:hypothetical protein